MASVIKNSIVSGTKIISTSDIYTDLNTHLTAYAVEWIEFPFLEKFHRIEIDGAGSKVFRDDQPNSKTVFLEVTDKRELVQIYAYLFSEGEFNSNYTTSIAGTGSDDAIGGGGGGATNLSTTRTATVLNVISDTGTNAALPVATTALAGTLSAADKIILDGLAANDVVTTEGDIVVGNGSGDPSRLGIGANGEMLFSDGTTLAWGPAPADISDFMSLTDTPANFTGAALQFARVNAGETGLEFAAETTTTLGYVSGTQTLTYTDETGTATAIDLSALALDIYVDGATLVGDTLTLTDNDGGTGDLTIDLSAYVLHTEVVDDLTTGGATVPLSAAQGVALKALIDALDVVTTQGDIMVGDAGGDPVRLALGATGQVLKSDGTDAVWSAQVAADVGFTPANQFVSTDLQAGLAEAQVDVVTTEGDLVIGGTAGIVQRLGVGTVDQILISDGTTFSWQNSVAEGIDDTLAVVNPLTADRNIDGAGFNLTINSNVLAGGVTGASFGVDDDAVNPNFGLVAGDIAGDYSVANGTKDQVEVSFAQTVGGTYSRLKAELAEVRLEASGAAESAIVKAEQDGTLSLNSSTGNIVLGDGAGANIPVDVVAETVKALVFDTTTGKVLAQAASSPTWDFPVGNATVVAGSMTMMAVGSTLTLPVAPTAGQELTVGPANGDWSTIAGTLDNGTGTATIMNGQTFPGGAIRMTLVFDATNNNWIGLS